MLFPSYKIAIVRWANSVMCLWHSRWISKSNLSPEMHYYKAISIYFIYSFWWVIFLQKYVVFRPFFFCSIECSKSYSPSKMQISEAICLFVVIMWNCFTLRYYWGFLFFYIYLIFVWLLFKMIPSSVGTIHKCWSLL